jgi:hypothetical protein
MLEWMRNTAGRLVFAAGGVALLSGGLGPLMVASKGTEGALTFAILPLVVVIPIAVLGLIFATEDHPELAGAGFIGVPFVLFAYVAALQVALTYEPSLAYVFLPCAAFCFLFAALPSVGTAPSRVTGAH